MVALEEVPDSAEGGGAVAARGAHALPPRPAEDAPKAAVVAYVEALKEVGNRYFREKDFHRAGPTYTDAVRAALGFYPEAEGGKAAMLADQEMAPVVAKCYSNSAQAALMACRHHLRGFQLSGPIWG